MSVSLYARMQACRYVGSMGGWVGGWVAAGLEFPSRVEGCGVSSQAFLDRRFRNARGEIQTTVDTRGGKEPGSLFKV